MPPGRAGDCPPSLGGRQRAAGIRPRDVPGVTRGATMIPGHSTPTSASATCAQRPPAPTPREPHHWAFPSASVTSGSRTRGTRPASQASNPSRSPSPLWASSAPTHTCYEATRSDTEPALCGRRPRWAGPRRVRCRSAADSRVDAIGTGDAYDPGPGRRGGRRSLRRRRIPPEPGGGPVDRCRRSVVPT